MIPLRIYWSNVGTWDSIYDYYEKDELGNVLKADAKLVECKNSMFISEHRLVVGIGTKDGAKNNGDKDFDNSEII